MKNFLALGAGVCRRFRRRSGTLESMAPTEALETIEAVEAIGTTPELVPA